MEGNELYEIYKQPILSFGERKCSSMTCTFDRTIHSRSLGSELALLLSRSPPLCDQDCAP